MTAARLNRVALEVVADAAEPPVSLADAKAHLNLELGEDDALVTALVSAARDYVERATATALVATKYKMTVDGFPSHSAPLYLPREPLVTVDAVQYLADDGAATLTAWGSSNYRALVGSPPGVGLALDTDWPETAALENAVFVTFTAGHTDAATLAARAPALVHAVKLLVGAWYEFREDLVGGMPIASLPAPLAVRSLLQLNRRIPV